VSEGGDPQSRRQAVLRRRAAMLNERSSWLDHWKEISEFQQPRLGRYLVSDSNRGQKRFQSVIDNTSLLAARTLGAGMMSGMTSPARPWFRMALADRDLMEFGPVKAWLFKTQSIMRDVFAHSNTYRSLQMMYEELGLFGTSASIVLPDFESVVHSYPLTTGEYAIGTDHRGYVDSIVRDFQMTVGQLVGQFGLDNCSQTVKSAYERRNFDQRLDVIHMIEPRRGRDVAKRDAKNMAWCSVYMETGANEDKFLSESGFKRFPALVPRWSVTGNDTYGSSPGMEVLGDVKQLQHQQLRKGQGIDYMVNPPIQVPTAYKDAARARLPGGVMFVDSVGAGNGVRSAFDVQLNLQHLVLDIQDVRERIRSGFYADLFLMLANDTRSGITATEVAERHEEKLLMLGPVLERLHNELLEPLIDMTFERCSDAGILPPPPKELQGKNLSVEFISTLAQAQRVVSAQGVDRLLGSVTSLAALFPQVVDKINADQVVDDYADLFGVNPEIVVPDDVAAAAREQKLKAAQAQQQAAAVPAMADSAKKASEIDPQNMRDVMNMFQGYGSPG
jgi:hypothetical protein